MNDDLEMAGDRGRQVLEALVVALRPAGLNLVGAAGVAAYDARSRPERRSDLLLPGARSIIVIASGGPALWDAFLADLRDDPSHLTDHADPLDAYVERQIDRADRLLEPLPRRWFYPSANASIHLDFRTLALIAGLGTDSRMRLLMNPHHGLWLGLRAACFLGIDVPITPTEAPDLCHDCPAPCVAACPGDAFPEGVWNVDRCGAFHQVSDRCADRCDARLACPQGESSRYPVEELRYHSNRAAGRRWLREYLGLPDGADRFEGVGPLWGTWREKIGVKRPS